MILEKPLAAYTGGDPYIFVSYSHRDELAVHSEIRLLQDQGINVWFDEGIVPGDEWSETLASAINGSSWFVYYISPNSVVSEHCRRELTYANDCGTHVIGIYLEPAELPGGLRLSLGNRQLIDRYGLEPSLYLEKLGKVFSTLSSGAMPPTLRAKPATETVAGDKRRSILIAPFRNLSKADDDYISVGLADEITMALSSVESIRVISRGSAMQIDAEELGLDKLRHQLNVQFVVQGNVQVSGKRLRIMVQMANTQSHEIVWAKKWNSTIDGFFDVQDGIAEGVVDALEIQLNPHQKERLTERPIPDMRAYEYYLRARHLIYQFTGEALNQALDYLRLGADIVGDNVLITAAMGYVYWQFINAGIDPDPKYIHEARKCADKLLALDPESPEGHRLMGLVTAHEKGSIQISTRHLKLALEANPNDTDTLFWLPLLYSFVGRVSSGQALAERLLALDPLTTFLQILPGFLYMMDGDLPRGRTCLLKSHESNPGNPITTLAYGQVLAMNGRKPDAEAVFASLENFVPDSFFSQLGSFYIHALRGDKQAGLAAVTDVLNEGAGSDLQYSWSMAQCFVLIDEYDSAIDWLENAAEHGLWNYPLLSERDPLLEPLREHERFRALMVDVKKKWIDFEV